MKTIIILYVPVIHRGYINFLQKYLFSDLVYVLGQDLVDELVEYKEIRALPPIMVAAALSSLEICHRVHVLSGWMLAGLQEDQESIRVITADESISRKFIEKYLPCIKDVTYDTTFLRWDGGKVFSVQEVSCDRISIGATDRTFMAEAQQLAQASSDWWRQVGAILVTANHTFRSHNHHVPSEYTPYINGDPRDSIKAGTHSEFSSALHSEKAVFAQALRTGISTDGADLYTTVFPCPDCAKLIAYSGVKRLFFQTGHASLDGVEVLKAKGVEIIKVE